MRNKLLLNIVQRLFFIISIFLAYPSYATITLTEDTALSFGLLEIPNATKNIIIDRDGGMPTGTANILIDNSTSRGVYTLTGSDAHPSISIDIQNISTGSSELTLNNFKGKYGAVNIDSFPVGGLTLPGTGTILYLGATLEFTSQVNSQTYNMSFDLVVNYE
jgi:hypothetical protein